MTIALAPLPSHLLVWTLIAAVAASVWLARAAAIRALDWRDPEPDPAELYALFRTVDEDDALLVGEDPLAS